MPKSKHIIYTVQGVRYMYCEESKCEDIYLEFVSKKELLEMDMNHSHTVQIANNKGDLE
jgi:hypothetical protein